MAQGFLKFFLLKAVGVFQPSSQVLLSSIWYFVDPQILRQKKRTLLTATPSDSKGLAYTELRRLRSKFQVPKKDTLPLTSSRVVKFQLIWGQQKTRRHYQRIGKIQGHQSSISTRGTLFAMRGRHCWRQTCRLGGELEQTNCLIGEHSTLIQVC